MAIDKTFEAALSKLEPVERIDWLARYIILHSIIYYEMNNNIISDRQYDEVSKYLAKLIQGNADIVKQCHYYEVIHDFTGETGFYLKDRLDKDEYEYLTKIASWLIKRKGSSQNVTKKNKKNKKK